MIPFYENWNRDFHLGNDITQYIVDFLSQTSGSSEIFSTRDENSISLFFSIISSIPISIWFQELKKLNIEKKYNSYNIPCFSSFEAGIIRLPEILEFHEEGLSFEEIGYELIKAETKLARVKYGENHSKLAASIKLVSISKSRPYCVKLSPIGHFLVGIKMQDKQSFIKILLLLDPYYSYIIKKALIGDINYSDTVDFLSEKTQLRRRSNVKTVLQFVFKGTDQEKKFFNIHW